MTKELQNCPYCNIPNNIWIPNRKLVPFMWLNLESRNRANKTMWFEGFMSTFKTHRCSNCGELFNKLLPIGIEEPKLKLI